MFKKEEVRFLYSASAVALSGTLQRPYLVQLPPEPSISLPQTGGAGFKKFERIHLEDAVRVAAAEVRVVGGERGDHYSTLATATVEGLNILDMVTADRVVARVASESPKSPTTDFLEEKNEEGESLKASTFRFFGSYFENLRIAGRPYPLELTEPFTRDSGVRAPENGIVNPVLFGLRSDSTNGPDRGIHIPEFGSIYLGELFFINGVASLTMIRVELGCSHTGTITGPGVNSDGHRFPPSAVPR